MKNVVATNAAASRSISNSEFTASRSIQNSKLHPSNWFGGSEEDLSDFEILFHHAMGKIVYFLVFLMPLVYLAMMCVGGYTMSSLAGLSFKQGFNMMAPAFSGGAIALPSPAVQDTHSKLFAALMASFGVGMWGFMVAVLSHSVVAPLVCALGIEVSDSEVEREEDSWGTIFRRLGVLALGIVKINILLAVVFGIFLSIIQGWSFVTGFETMASVVLGGGIEFASMSVVTHGRLIYTIVGVWSFGLSSLMVAIAGDPGHKLLCEAVEINPFEDDTPWKASRALMFIVFLVLPLTLLFLMLAVAVVMAPLSSFKFENAFAAALPAISGGAAHLSHAEDPPLQVLEATIFICAASIGFFVLSAMMGVGGELIGPIIEGPIFGPFLGKSLTKGHAIVALFGICAVLIPTVVACSALVVGTMLAYAMGWPLHEGFWWCVAAQLGGGVELSSKVPDSLLGMLLATMAVAWSIGISILAIGFSGAPVVEPIMNALHMTLDPEELDKLGISCKATRRAPISPENSPAARLLGQSLGKQASYSSDA